MQKRNSTLILILLTLVVSTTQAKDPLPSWNEGEVKQNIVTFVKAVSTKSSPNFVPKEERIAVFDNDGTLWTEKPIPIQLSFALDRIKALSSEHPEWKTTQPFKAVLEGDIEKLKESGLKGLMKIAFATHANMGIAEFKKSVKEWVKKTKNSHTKTRKLYKGIAYQPMLELLAYMRENGFKTYIVSGGGIEFMRAWAKELYGIPPEQVIGTSTKTKFVLKEGKPMLMREPALNFNDDKEGKPVAINLHIGREPIAAFGNSDGDLQMLQWTTMAKKGLRFGLIIHHTDAEREWKYDRKALAGRLDKALDLAPKQHWNVVDMKKDWKRVFADIK